MSNLLIRDVPEELKDKLVAAAHKAGRSLDEEARLRLQVPATAESTHEQDRAPMSGAEFVRSIQDLFAHVPTGEREAFSAIMDEIEAERRKDYGRPMTFGE
jgi:antitoxin FitA